MAESYRYDIVVLSNCKEIPLSSGKVDPEELSLIEEFVGDLRRRYRDKRVYCYPKDALPGRDIFDELFESIDGSRWIVVLFTTGSQESRPWLDYSNKMSFIHAGLGREGRFKDYIPVNLNVWDLPRMIDNKTVIDFRERAAAAWDKLDGVFNGGDRDAQRSEKDIVQETNFDAQRSEKDIVQETNFDVQRSEKDIVQDGSSHPEEETNFGVQNTLIWLIAKLISVLQHLKYGIEHE